MSKKEFFTHFFKLLIIYSLLWAILSGAKIDLFALIFILLLAITTPFMFTLQRAKFHYMRIFTFFFFFLKYSFIGGLGVARLAVKKNLVLTPTLYKLPLKTTNDFTSVMLANIYSLMPGTLTMDIVDGTLTLHVLDDSLFDKLLIDEIQNRVIQALEGGK